MYKNIITVLLFSLSLSACSIHQAIEPSRIAKSDELCVIVNSAVRDGFLSTYQIALKSKGIEYRLIEESKKIPEECEWTSTYTANWQWDMTMYMSYAEIKIFRNGSLDGEAIYDARSGGANMSKFIDAEPKIEELVNELFSFDSAYLMFLNIIAA